MIYRIKHLLHKNRHRERFALLDGLLRNQTLTREQLLGKQQNDLSAIINYAFCNVPYYREKYAQAVRNEANEFAVSSLPILHKDEVIQHRDEMLARGFDRNRLRIGNTGGSTGKPVSFYYDAYKGELMRAGMCRSYMGSGWKPGQKILNFWGARQDIKGGSSFGKIVNDAVAAEKTIAAYEYTEAQLHGWAGTIRSYQPVLLQGYASILAELAGYIIDHKIRMPNTLLGVFSTAEVLYGWQRELIEQAFQCQVFNQYGSREIPNIACECRHGNQHIFTDMVYLESVNFDHEDRLVITSLTNRVMPFIRYEIGDSGRLKEGDCACGSPFPMMEMGLCRSNDIIKTRSGKSIYPAYFIHLLDGLAEIKQYQFIQSEPDKITLNLVSPSGLSAETLNSLRARVRGDVDENMVLEINHVDEIRRTLSGKHRFVISNQA
ncbi:MAG: phenylacetate--CoA ligase family protein [Sulfuricella sp.]